MQERLLCSAETFEKDITIINPVVDVLRQGDNVQKIILENGSHVDADLYIDCTGWANVLQDNIDKVNQKVDCS